jgi:hypothetical protein
MQLIHRPVRNEQPVANEQRLHAVVDQRFIQLKVVESSGCLLAGTGQDGKKYNSEYTNPRNRTGHGHNLFIVGGAYRNAAIHSNGTRWGKIAADDADPHHLRLLQTR